MITFVIFICCHGFSSITHIWLESSNDSLLHCLVFKEHPHRSSFLVLLCCSSWISSTYCLRTFSSLHFVAPRTTEKSFTMLSFDLFTLTPVKRISFYILLQMVSFVKNFFLKFLSSFSGHFRGASAFSLRFLCRALSCDDLYYITRIVCRCQHFFAKKLAMG